MFPFLAVGLGLLGLDLYIRSQGKGVASGSSYPIVTTDPGIDPSHPLGVLPCPTDPPAPPGLRYWQGPVPPAVGAWAVHALHTYPIGTIIQDLVNGQPVAARIEYHTLQGATGLTGCFKGCSLMQATAPVA
jgi:hypothetical protein